MILAAALLALSAAAIYLCSESFTNGVEWLGARLRLGQTATGTVLAAFGTALPESVVTLVATAFGEAPAQKDIGIGAAMGGPLALSTVAYAAVGVTLLGLRRASNLPAPERSRLTRDQCVFLALFAAKVTLGVVAFADKPWCGCLFLLAYALYLRGEMRNPGAHAAEHELEPLKLRPRQANPHMAWILAQCFGAAAVTFLASRLFVDQLELLAPALGLSPQATALLLSPIATELPETMNAVIWVRQGKDRLALANISGSMMVQATVPTSFGLFFTPWLLDRALLLGAAATASAILYLTLLFRFKRVHPLWLMQAIWPLAALLACVW